MNVPHRPQAATPVRRELVVAFPWARWAMGAGLIATAALLLYRQIDVGQVHAAAERFNGVAAFALLAVLPLAGFPASVLHVAAGIRFGSGLGLLLVAASIFLQLLASYAIVHLWRHRLARWAWVQRLRRRIPRGAHASLCVFAVLLPGAPYSGINYVLPLMGVPFRTYLCCCLPLHTFRATVTVFLGDHSDHLTGARLAWLVGYALLILGASAWMFHRLRSQLGDPPARAGGRKQLA